MLTIENVMGAGLENEGQPSDVNNVLELQICHRVGLVDLGLQAVINGTQFQFDA